MGNALANLSNIIIPALIFYVVGYGIIHHTNVYEDFIKGAKDGFHTVIDIMPTLIGLMMAVGILRASGFLEFFGGLLGKLTEPFGLPAPVVPVIIVKLFSSLSSDRAGAGYFQKLWNGFQNRHDDLHSVKLYGNLFLHHERLLHGCQGDENQVHSDRSAACDGCGEWPPAAADRTVHAGGLTV